MSGRYARTPAPAEPQSTATTVPAGTGRAGLNDPLPLVRQRGPSTQAQAAALHRASGGRLARAGPVLLQLQRLNGNTHVQQVISNARRAASQEAAPSAVGADVARALQQARGGGRPLPATVRWSMEQALDADFGGVRVHTGAQSDQLNQSLQAAAFTSGKDIFFRRGAYQPGSPRGTALLAHELTHVVQQQNMRRGTVQRFFDPPADPYLNVIKPDNPEGRTQKAPHPSKTAGWAISKNVEPAQEMLTTGRTETGYKVNRFTALLTPGHPNLSKGGGTQKGTDPLGWAWVESNEVRTASGKLRYWVRFHLLNAKLGGKGSRERHLVPTTKTANAQWDVNLERPMAAALKNVGATPVYYDVTVTYWTAGDAPESYVDATSGTNYKPNITLFPRTIAGRWQRYQKGKWVPQTPVTVNVDQPRGISGEDVELSTHKKLDRLAKLFHIDKEILGLLQHQARHKAFATYGDVRKVLEAWAMAGQSPKKISERQQAIYESDGYLRTALTGLQSFKLKINGKRVPDDATPEAKMFGPPVHAKSYLDLDRYEKVAGDVAAAYIRAQSPERDVVHTFPSFEEFLWLLTTKVPLFGVKLTAVQQLWDGFKDANETLPPMRDTHLVPDQDEIRVVVQRRTQDQVVHWVRKTFGDQARGLTQPGDTVTVTGELADAVAAEYGNLLQQRFTTLTVGDLDDVSRLASALLQLDPVRPLAAELSARLAAVPAVVSLRIQGTISNPFTTPLTTKLADEMQRQIADEQQRQLLAPQQPAQLPHARPTQTQPVHHPGPYHRPGTSGRPGPYDRPDPSGRPGSYRHGSSGPRHRSASLDEPAPRIHPHNERVIRAVRDAVFQHSHYPADESARAEIQKRLALVEKKWISVWPAGDLSTFDQDVSRAVRFVIEGR